MSQERDVKVIKNPESTKSDAEVKAEAESMDEKVARISALYADVLERGYVNDRIAVTLPPHLHGEWIRNNDVDINDAKFLGFEIDKEYAPKRGLHGDNAEVAVLGDTIFMTCPKEVKIALDKIQAKFIDSRHNPKKPAEEANFESTTRSGTGGIIPTINNSRTDVASGDDITEALRTLERQTISTGG